MHFKEAFLGQAARVLSQRAGSASKALTGKALTAKGPASTALYGAAADLTGRVAKNPRTAMGLAGAGAAGMGAGMAMSSKKASDEEVAQAAEMIASPEHKVNEVLPAVSQDKRDDVLAKLRSMFKRK